MQTQTHQFRLLIKLLVWIILAHIHKHPNKRTEISNYGMVLSIIHHYPEIWKGSEWLREQENQMFFSGISIGALLTELELYFSSEYNSKDNQHF